MSKTNPNPSNTQDPFAGEEEGMLPKPADLLYLFLERWWIGLLLGIIAATAYGWHALQEVPVYQSRAQMIVEPSEQKVLDVATAGDAFADGQEALQMHSVRLNSRAFREAVWESMDDEARAAFVEAYRNPETGDTPNGQSIFARNFEVWRGNNARIFVLGMRHRDPQMAAEMANRATAVYVEFLMDLVGASNENKKTFLQREETLAQENLDAAEAALQEYRREHDIVWLEENRKGAASRLQRLNSLLTEIQLQRTEKETALHTLQKAQAEEVDVSEVPALASDEEITQLHQAIAQAEVERAQLSERYLRRHPRMIENATLMENLQERLTKAISSKIAAVQNEIALLDERKSRLEADLAQVNKEILLLNDIAAGYAKLENDLQNRRETFNTVVRKLHETNISSRLDSINIQVLDAAKVSWKPISPDKQGIFIKAGMLFVILLGGVPVGLGLLDNRLRTFSDVENYLKKDLIGDIPARRAKKGENLSRMVEDNLDDAMVENFRGIFSMIEILEPNHHDCCLLVTSTLPAEGKSFIAANLACLFARHGHSSVLLDCDMRRPAQHRNSGVANDSGLLRWHQSGLPVPDSQEAFLASEELGLVKSTGGRYLLRAGGCVKNPSEIMGSERFGQLIEGLKKHFGVVVIDSPPLAVFPDAFFLTEYADRSIYVCRQLVAKRQKARHYVRKLDESAAPVLGVILNGIKRRRGLGIGSQGTYSYGYGYDTKKYQKYYQQPEN